MPENLDDSGNSKMLVCSNKVEDSAYASVDLMHASPSYDVLCSSTSLDGEKRSLVSPEELEQNRCKIKWPVHKHGWKDTYTSNIHV